MSLLERGLVPATEQVSSMSDQMSSITYAFIMIWGVPAAMGVGLVHDVDRQLLSDHSNLQSLCSVPHPAFMEIFVWQI